MLFFCKYYAELAKTFVFCLTLGQTGSGILSDPWKNMYTEKHLIELFNDHDYM
jgi:hypothetical protein